MPYFNAIFRALHPMSSERVTEYPAVAFQERNEDGQFEGTFTIYILDPYRHSTYWLSGVPAGTGSGQVEIKPKGGE